jgi:ribonuclease HI
MTTGNAHLYRHGDFHRLFSLENIGIHDPQPSEWVYENSEGTFRHLNRYHAVVVSVDGACSGNGKPWAKGGYGVYFGPNSEYNVSNPLKEHQPQTSQRAELTACLVALNQIERIASNYTFIPQSGVFIIVTDSAYLVDSLTNYIYKWNDNGFVAASGREVVNRDLFERIDDKLDAMEFGRQKIPVLFWKVDRSENEDADELAKDAVY